MSYSFTPAALIQDYHVPEKAAAKIKARKSYELTRADVRRWKTEINYFVADKDNMVLTRRARFLALKEAGAVSIAIVKIHEVSPVNVDIAKYHIPAIRSIQRRALDLAYELCKLRASGCDDRSVRRELQRVNKMIFHSGL
jgi:hypothetical protein